MPENKLQRKEIIQEVRTILRQLVPFKVIIFGSLADGNFKEGSDIDLVVVLNKKGISKNYAELLENKLMVAKLLRDLRKRIAIDFFIYTRDEWKMLLKSGSSFHNSIEKNGIHII